MKCAEEHFPNDDDFFPNKVMVMCSSNGEDFFSSIVVVDTSVMSGSNNNMPSSYKEVATPQEGHIRQQGVGYKVSITTVEATFDTNKFVNTTFGQRLEDKSSGAKFLQRCRFAICHSSKGHG